ncbi:MAG: phytanoyl-CoA dioxygenase family protein [Bacteroidota bacterium]
MASIKNSLQKIRRIYGGFKILKKTGKTPDFAYHAMRSLFVETGGSSNDVISKLIKQKKYEGINFSDGVLQFKNSTELKDSVKSLQQNGFHIFDAKLDEATVNKIVDYAKSTPCKYRKINENSTGSDYKIEITEEEGLFDESNPKSPIYQFKMDNIVQSKELQELIFDTSLLAFAQEYLDSKPILDLLAMWWSVPFAGKGKSEAAQMYHFDLDRIKFVKFFFYLTDVDGETGPHCYVKGSHKKLHPTLKRDGRFSDEEVEKAFGKNNLLELSGKKGSIMVVDTRGLHKGKDLTKDKRLIFQIEFANSMFGQVYPPCKKPQLRDELDARYKKYFDTYSATIE